MERIESTAEAERAATSAALMATYEAPIGRYLSRLVGGDLELARDLTQDTFLSAYRALPGAEIANPGGWLYRIATNHALAYFRRRRLARWVPLSFLRGGRDPAHEGHADRVATGHSVEAALARLDPHDRACLLLKAAGFSGDEIAAQLGCSVGAARMRLCRARATFRRHYGDDNADD